MNEMQKLKFEMGRSLVMALFGCLVFAIFMMLLLGLFGHVTEDFVRRDWALSWAWFMFVGTVIYAVVMSFVMAGVRVWLKKKR